MAKSRYKWLKEEQTRASRKESKSLKELRKQLAVAAGPPLGSQALGNTGLGEDGQLQPSNPTQMVGTQEGPLMLHEGEDLTRNPDGSMTVTPVSQSQLKGIERDYGIPGAQRGGTFRPSAAEAKGSGGRAAAGVDPRVLGGARPPAAVAKGSLRGGRSSAQMGNLDLPLATSDGVAAGAGAVPSTQMGNLNLDLSATGDPNAPNANLDALNNPPADPAATTPVAQVGQGDSLFNQSTGIMSQIAAGQDPQLDQQRQSERMRLKGEEQAASGALAQDMSQLGMTGREGLTERAMLQGQFGGQEVEAMRGINEQAAARQMQAVNSMATLGLQKSQQEYTRKVDAAQALIEAGGADNFAQASTAFESLYGVPLNTDRMLTAESRADFASGMENITKYIASGMGWDDAFTAMQNDGTIDMLGMAPESAKAMYEKMALNGDPVYQAMNSLDDDTLATLFPDMDPAEARSTIGKMHLLGVGTFDADGKFQIDYDMLESLGLSVPGGGGGPGGGLAVTPEQRATAFGTFTENLNPELAENATQSVWENLGQPTTQEFETWYNSGGQNMLTIMSNPADFEAEFERIWRLTSEHNSTDNPDKKAANSLELSNLLSEIAPNMTVEDWARTGRWMNDTVAPLVSDDIRRNIEPTTAGDPITARQVELGWFDNYGYSPDELATMVADGTTLTEVVPMAVYDNFAAKGWGESQIVSMWKFYSMGVSRHLWSSENRSGLEGALVGENAVGTF